MITCRELIDFLMDYLDGTLPAGERALFEEHLRVCPPCVDFLNMYRTTIQLERAAGRDGPASPTPEIPEKLRHAILAAQKKK